MAEHVNSTSSAAAPLLDKAARTGHINNPPAPDHQQEMDPLPTANTDHTTTIPRRTLPALLLGFLALRGTPALAAPAAPPQPGDNPDATLLGWCAAAIAMEEEWWLDPTEHWQRPTGYYETIDAITATPARTDAGNRAKLAVAVSFYQPDPPEEGSIVGRILWDAMTALASPPVAAPMVAESPDAALIALCAEHVVNVQAYNLHGGKLEPEDDPLWHAYERTRDTIDDAAPQTLAGMAAKAKAAKAEAAQPLGEIPDGTVAATWAWDLVNDILRLHGAEGLA